ncbi:MAG: DUF5695 domain-containing protein [Velocimicrobium sp.]
MKKKSNSRIRRVISTGLAIVMGITMLPTNGLTIVKAAEKNVLSNAYFNVEIGEYGEISSLKIVGDEFDTDYVLNAKNAPNQGASEEHQWMGELMFQTKKASQNSWIESMTSASSKNSSAREIKKEGNKVTVTYGNEAAEKGIKDFTLTETYELVDNQLKWSMKVTNPGNENITFGDFGLPMTFNEYWTSQYANEYLYETRVVDHSFVGQDSSYIYAQRPSGQGKMLVFTPDVSTGAKLEYQDHWRVNNGHAGSAWAQDQGGWANGLNVFYIHSNAIKSTGSSYLENTELTLKPGESKEYRFDFTAAQDESAMKSVLYNQGIVDAVAVPSMAFSVNMPAEFYLHTKYAIDKIKNVYVECSHDTHLYEGLKNSVSNKQECTKDAGTSVIYKETKIVDGEQYHIYDLKLSCLGANNVVVCYEDEQGNEKKTTLQFYAMDSAENALDLHADFVTKYTQVDAPGEISDKIFDDWMMDTEDVRGVYKGYFGWGDDWGFTHGEYLAEKNVYLPVKEQIQAVDNYLDIAIWNGLMREHHEDYLVNDWLDDEPNNTGQGTSRGYAYPHVYNTYFSMYKIASKYPDMIAYSESKDTYLLRSYHILKALYSKGVGYNWDTGLMGESTTPDIISALTKEGYYKEAQEIIDIMNKKYKNFSGQKYPYGSEYSYDNTGEEAVYVLAKLQNNLDMMKKIDLKTRACRGVQPIWYHYGNPTTICGENWWNFQYSASLIGYCMDDWLRLQENGLTENEKALASRVNYAAKLANLTCINSGQIDASEKNIGTVAWTYQAELGNSGGQGTGGGNIHNGWRQMSGEADTGLFGAMRILSSDVANDPVFGLFGYGCSVAEKDNKYEVTPLDGLYTRLNFINEGLYIELDKDQYSQAVVSKDKDYIELSMKNLEESEHVTDVELTGLKEGSYQVSVNDQITGSFKVDEEGIQNTTTKQTERKNVALLATPSAQRTCGEGTDAHVAALNNGIDPVSSSTADQYFGADGMQDNIVWHNWAQCDDPAAEDYESSCYVQYNWDSAVTIDETSAYYMCTPENTTDQWTPGAVSYQYLSEDGTTWMNVQNATGAGIEINQYNKTCFDPVTTKALRMTMQKADGVRGLGVLEWQVMGTATVADEKEQENTSSVIVSVPMPAMKVVNVKIATGAALENTAPQVDAGEDITVSASENIHLRASVTDDGYPDMTLDSSWSVESMPEGATVNISNIDKLITSVDVDKIGEYVFKLTVSDGALSSADTVKITVKEDEPLPLVLAYYTFDNVSEDKRNRELKSADDAGVGYRAEQVSNPELAEGKDGLALSSKSSYCGYIRLSKNLTKRVDQTTIAMDVKLGDLQGNDARLFEFADTQGDKFYVSVVNGNQLEMGITDSLTKEMKRVTTSAKFGVGYWKNVEVTLKDNVAILYVEGIEKGRIEACNFKLSDLGETQRNFIGRGDNKSGVFFNGLIDNFQMNSYAMDTQEILQKYQYQGEKSPVSAEISDMVVVAGTTPELPNQIDVLYTDGSYDVGSVIWETIKPSDFDKKGMVTLKGQVQGITDPITLTIHVVEGDAINVASLAEPSAIINSVNDLGGVAGLNDGYLPTNSKDTSHGVWHNWLGNQGGTAWVQYDWSEEIVLTSTSAYYFKDNGGNFKPSSAYYEYKDSNGNWKQLTKTVGLGVEADTFNKTTFSPVMATALRMVMTPAALGCGVIEWEVYGYSNTKLVTKTELKDAISQAEGIKESLIAKGYETLAPALLAAKKAVEDSSVNQQQVDEATDSLYKTIAGLTPLNNNLAYTAKVSTSYISAWEKLTAVNDGVDADNSMAAGIDHYGTWGNESAYETVTYTWGKEVNLDQSNAYFWNDGGGILTPSAYSYEYLDENGEWKQVEKLTGLEAVLDQYNETKLTDITTKSIKIIINKQEENEEGIGLVEWQVIGTYAKAEEPWGGPVIVVNPEIEDPETTPAKGEKIYNKDTLYVVTSASSDKMTVTYKGDKTSDKTSDKTTIKIPSSVTIEGIEYKVTKVGVNAFRNNKHLQKVIIGENVKKIGKSAFRGCTSLTKVTLGKDVESIEKTAFSGNKKLKTIVIDSVKIKKINALAFDKTKQNIKIVVPAKKEKAYQKLFRALKTNKTFKIVKAKK